MAEESAVVQQSKPTVVVEFNTRPFLAVGRGFKRAAGFVASMSPIHIRIEKVAPSVSEGEQE